ncbi:MAG: prolipoprotein diacylglyceryl transferase, partial [Pyrinomonadaceae bacterium]|nr:prolipoprotein diacylglyceryl transferase [Pyrinomonadaceae bacterium]
AIALLAALFVAARLGKNDGIPSERMYDLGLWILIAGLLGSKLLLFVVDESYRTNPWLLFSLDFLRSGGVFYGGFLGGVLATWLLVKRYKLPFWKVADAFAPAVALGQTIGRQACFAAGCCWGKATSLPWGVHFGETGNANTGVPIYDNDGHNLYLHPTQLYESFAMLIAFGLLYWLHGRKRFNGQVFITYAMIYAFVRFTVEFFRGDNRGTVFGLNDALGVSTSQLISLIVGIAAFIFLVIRARKPKVAEDKGV